MLQCDECALWRLVYAKRKLNSAEKKDLESAIDSMSYSCGALLKDAEISSSLKDIVFMRQLQCHSPIEKLYIILPNTVIFAFIVPLLFQGGIMIKNSFILSVQIAVLSPQLRTNILRKERKLNFVVCVCLSNLLY